LPENDFMLKNFIQNFKIPVKFHLLFWGILFVFNVIRFGSLNQDYWYSINSNIVTLSLEIIFTYYTIYFLIERFIVTKKYVHFFVFFSFSLAIFYFIRTGLIYLLVTKDIWPEKIGSEPFTFDHIAEVSIGTIYIVAFAATIKLTYEWLLEKKQNEELQKIQLQTELSFLKTQIQPHFFFNTLNNLYALVINKSPNAPDVVLKLSEIMQYILYEVKEPKVSLLKAINYIYSYLELEKLRYGDQVKSDIEIVGNIDDVEIPPLLFLPFIENCFKHGKINDHIKVDIRFEIQDNFLFFTVINNFENIDNNNSNQGIGIENVKRRLQLLYGENASLTTKINKNKFKVLLKLPIE